MKLTMAFCFMIIFLLACVHNKGTPTPMPGSPQEALDKFITALNQGDNEGMYNSLSSSARDTTLEHDWREIIRQQRETYGNLKVSLKKVKSTILRGEEAKLEVALTITLGNDRIPLDGETTLEREEGRWGISDSLIEGIVTAVGGYNEPEVKRVFGPDGCLVGDTLAGVHAPKRLSVLNPCVTVTGTVVYVYKKAFDGDQTFDLILDGPYLHLLNEDNLRNRHGGLHIEIVPADQARVIAPSVGQRVRATGPWVLDHHHGWNEIHPAWQVELIP
ncbi:MAG: hypothetical protein HY664_04275 [Chloroflexi bacterium]|nr:hypothetical protein [Chloroflexota bacterium]